MTKNALSTIQGTLADPDKEKHEQARIKAKANLSRLQRARDFQDGGDGFANDASHRGPRIEELVLNEYENLVAMEVVAPEDIPVGFDGERSPVYSPWPEILMCW